MSEGRRLKAEGQSSAIAAEAVMNNAGWINFFKVDMLAVFAQ
jgi:hypothetical protein